MGDHNYDPTMGRSLEVRRSIRDRDHACSNHVAPTTFVPIPQAHARAARIARLLLVPVPLDECERFPDPDYGV